MKQISKHDNTYGKKADYISFSSYHYYDNLPHNSIVTASAQAVTTIL